MSRTFLLNLRTFLSALNLSFSLSTLLHIYYTILFRLCQHFFNFLCVFFRGISVCIIRTQLRQIKIFIFLFYLITVILYNFSCPLSRYCRLYENVFIKGPKIHMQLLLLLTGLGMVSQPIPKTPPHSAPHFKYAKGKNK